MNDGEMRSHVTIGRDQMNFAYYEVSDDCLYVHGDCPVSRLSTDHVGDVRRVPSMCTSIRKIRRQPLQNIDGQSK
jgi:hypothetical protein